MSQFAALKKSDARARRRRRPSARILARRKVGAPNACAKPVLTCDFARPGQKDCGFTLILMSGIDDRVSGNTPTCRTDVLAGQIGFTSDQRTGIASKRMLGYASRFASLQATSGAQLAPVWSADRGTRRKMIGRNGAQAPCSWLQVDVERRIRS